jgi:hypothetical protein
MDQLAARIAALGHRPALFWGAPTMPRHNNKVTGYSLALMVALILVGVTPLYVTATAEAEDGFMAQCVATIPRGTCECIAAKIPADKHAGAAEALRKSNAAMAVGGQPLDPSSLPQDQMQGLDAFVLAQASCI